MIVSISDPQAALGHGVDALVRRSLYRVARERAAEST